MFEVVVVGGGVCGASAAFHLANAGVKNILCLEMGQVGRGREKAVPGKVPESSIPSLTIDDEREYLPQISGSVTFDGGADGPNCIKMIAILPPYEPLDKFAEHHGWEGVRNYLRMAELGRDTEVNLARQVLPNPKTQVKQLGSLMVCTAEETARLRQEFDQLTALACECEWWDTPRVVAVHGTASEFTHGIFFPKDAIIDATEYARSLLRHAAPAVTLRENCPPVTRIWTSSEGLGCVQLLSGETVRAKHVIVATGGMYLDEHLAGIMRPCYSYLVGIPHREPEAQGGMPGGTKGDSPNFFTFGFSHDWSVSDGRVRLSGEDHFSGLKSPRVPARTKSLAEWAYKKYPYLNRADGYKVKHGVYSETPDHMPLVGTPRDGSAVCYMLGCNAWGQSSLSAAATLAPGLLGYKPLSPFERQIADLMSIRRFNAAFVQESSVQLTAKL